MRRRAARRCRRTSRAARAARCGAGSRPGRSRGMPAAASSSVTDSGSRRTPVSIAERPERDRQEQRHDEEDAGLDEVLEGEHAQPAAQLRRSRGATGRTSGSAPRSSSRDSHARNSQRGRAPPRISQSVAEMPEQVRRVRLRRDPAPRRSTAGRRRRRARGRAAESRTPTKSIRGRSPGGSSWIRRASDEDRRARSAPRRRRRSRQLR